MLVHHGENNVRKIYKKWRKNVQQLHIYGENVAKFTIFFLAEFLKNMNMKKIATYSRWINGPDVFQNLTIL
jgi:hypothetical protein